MGFLEADGEYVGVTEFSAEVGCSERTTRRYISSGELEAAYVGGKYLISRAAKGRFLKGRIGVRPGAQRKGVRHDAA